MKDISYDQAKYILEFCNRSMREVDKYSNEELLKLLDKYAEENAGKQIIVNPNNEDSVSVEEKYIAAQSYITALYVAIDKNIKPMLRMKGLFRYLYLFCDISTGFSETSRKILDGLSKLIDTGLKEEEINEVAIEISARKKKLRIFWIKYISFIVIFTDLIIMLLLFLFRR